VKPRRFPPPWRVEDSNHACFIVRDKNGQALAYFYLSMSPRADRHRVGEVEVRGACLVIRLTPFTSTDKVSRLTPADCRGENIGIH
jgi:hypothetical protein